MKLSCRSFRVSWFFGHKKIFILDISSNKKKKLNGLIDFDGNRPND